MFPRYEASSLASTAISTMPEPKLDRSVSRDEPAEAENLEGGKRKHGEIHAAEDDTSSEEGPRQDQPASDKKTHESDGTSAQQPVAAGLLDHFSPTALLHLLHNMQQQDEAQNTNLMYHQPSMMGQYGLLMQQPSPAAVLQSAWQQQQMIYELTGGGMDVQPNRNNRPVAKKATRAPSQCHRCHPGRH